MLIFYLLERDSCLPLLMLCEKVIVPQLSLSAYRIVYCDGESARKAVHAIFVCLFVCFFFFYVGKSSRTPCPLLGGVRVVSDSNRLKPHGGLPDVSQKWSGFSCEILPEHFFVFSLFVVKGGVLVLAWAARGEGEPQTP